MGFLRRTDQQFHWTDEGYGDFEGFLAALASRKRKAIRKERRDALAHGIEIEWLTGSDLTEAALGRVLRLLHGHRLAQMGPPLPEPPLLLAPRRADGRRECCSSWRSATAATSPARSTSSAPTRSTAAIGARSRSTLPAFRGLLLPGDRVRAGAWAEARRGRGARARTSSPAATCRRTTYSAHYIADPNFRRAVANYLEHERREVAAQGEALAEHAPFRHH